MTKDILCNAEVEPTDRLERCYWVDAVVLADAYQKQYPWINKLNAAEITTLMKGVHERIDYLTITGSLNLELTDQHY